MLFYVVRKWTKWEKNNAMETTILYSLECTTYILSLHVFRPCFTSPLLCAVKVRKRQSLIIINGHKKSAFWLNFFSLSQSWIKMVTHLFCVFNDKRNLCIVIEEMNLSGQISNIFGLESGRALRWQATFRIFGGPL